VSVLFRGLKPEPPVAETSIEGFEETARRGRAWRLRTYRTALVPLLYTVRRTRTKSRD